MIGNIDLFKWAPRLAFLLLALLWIYVIALISVIATVAGGPVLGRPIGGLVFFITLGTSAYGFHRVGLFEWW